MRNPLLLAAPVFAALAIGMLSAAESPSGRRLIANGASGPAGGAGRLVNASVRARTGTGEESLIAGFVVAGPGTKPMLIRAVGPTLATLGVKQPLGDPRLELHDLRRGSIIAQSAAWGGNSNRLVIAADSVRLGAFALADDAADSALVAELLSGVYTANVSGTPGENGTALIELYDADESADPHLVNLSARTHVGAGDDVLTLGFVISGGGPRQVLLRGVGPGLVAQGIGKPLTDPRVELRDMSGRLVATNDDWGTTRDAAAIAATVGAFPLAPGSKDSALLAMLPPGVYTLQVKGDAGAIGVALAELYDVPVTEYQTRWTMLNVSPGNEQADCHLLELPDGRIVLIDVADAGDAGGTAVARLQARGIHHVDLVVLSHFHRDHYGRLRDLIEAGITVDRLAYNLPAPDATGTDAEAPWGFSRADSTALLQFLRDRGVDCFTPRAGERLIDSPLPDGTRATLDVVCLYDGANTPVGKTDTNDTSIILRLTYGATRVLFTGDLNSALGSWLATSDLDVKADLLKVPHHGTEGCAPDVFFDRVGARAVLVPSPRSLWDSDRSARIRSYFRTHGVPTYVSGVNGDVTVTLHRDGSTIECEQSPR